MQPTTAGGQKEGWPNMAIYSQHTSLSSCTCPSLGPLIQRWLSSVGDPDLLDVGEFDQLAASVGQSFSMPAELVGQPISAHECRSWALRGPEARQKQERILLLIAHHGGDFLEGKPCSVLAKAVQPTFGVTPHCLCC